MIRPLICSTSVLLIALGLCQSLLAQAQATDPPAQESNSELDSTFEKLTSKKAIAEVNRYRKALEKLEVDSQKEKDRLRKDLMDKLDVALRTSTKDKDYAEIQNLLDARLLLEKAGETDDSGVANNIDNSTDEEQRGVRKRGLRRPKKGEPSEQDVEMDIPDGNIQGRASQMALKKAKPFRNNKYLVIADKATWHYSRRICEKLGGHLVRVDDADEQAFLEKLAKQSFADGPKGNSVWIDASDEEVESEWHNSLGQPLPYKNWAADQPNNDDQLQHHACIRRDKGMQWNDDVSSMRARFICEWEDAAAEK